MRVIGRSAWAWLMTRIGLREPATQTTEPERRCLARHAEGRRRIVEIGVYHAANTALFRNLVHEDGEVIGIDPHPPGRLGVSFERWIAEYHVSRVRRARARLIRQFSHDAVTAWSEPVDFLFIDGDHSWDAIARDWNDWSPHVAKDGVVALHDSRSTPGKADLDSVRFTTDVVRQDPRFEVIDEVDSLTVLRRAASNRC
jgi:predicted O-methyltransferase YrrM